MRLVSCTSVLLDWILHGCGCQVKTSLYLPVVWRSYMGVLGSLTLNFPPAHPLRMATFLGPCQPRAWQGWNGNSLVRNHWGWTRMEHPGFWKCDTLMRPYPWRRAFWGFQRVPKFLLKWTNVGILMFWRLDGTSESHSLTYWVVGVLFEEFTATINGLLNCASQSPQLGNVKVKLLKSNHICQMDEIVK